MNDKAKAFCAEVQALLRQYDVRAIEAHGYDQFRVAFGGADDLILIQLGPGEEVWTQKEGDDGRHAYTSRQQPFMGKLTGLMGKHGVAKIQSIAVSAQYQGIAFRVEFPNQDLDTELKAITQTEISAAAAPEPRDEASVLATWTVKRGTAKGQPTETRQWTYTQADYHSDVAGAPDPGGEFPMSISVPMGPPHNVFTRRQYDSFYFAFMSPNPGVTNWVQLEFVWN